MKGSTIIAAAAALVLSATFSVPAQQMALYRATGHQAEVSEEGASFSASDRRWIKRLTQLMVVEVDRVPKASSTIPKEDLKRVRSIADPLI
ncbi:MAG: hypothetical protein AAFR79_06180 [Pseudomonadota bacterium]